MFGYMMKNHSEVNHSGQPRKLQEVVSVHRDLAHRVLAYTK